MVSGEHRIVIPVGQLQGIAVTYVGQRFQRRIELLGVVGCNRTVEIDGKAVGIAHFVEASDTIENISYSLIGNYTREEDEMHNPVIELRHRRQLTQPLEVGDDLDSGYTAPIQLPLHFPAFDYDHSRPAEILRIESASRHFGTEHASDTPIYSLVLDRKTKHEFEHWQYIAV